MTSPTSERVPHNRFTRHHPMEPGEHRKDRWLTPLFITDALGDFDLDPCGAPGHALAAQTYLIDNGQDGLALPWQGRVWCNPPYGRQTGPFLERLSDHGRGTALIFARTETSTWHASVWGRASAILFFKGRITFLDADGVPAPHNSGAPSALVAYGDDDAEILRACGLDGYFVDLRTPEADR